MDGPVALRPAASACLLRPISKRSRRAKSYSAWPGQGWGGGGGGASSIEADEIAPPSRPESRCLSGTAAMNRRRAVFALTLSSVTTAPAALGRCAGLATLRPTKTKVDVATTAAIVGRGAPKDPLRELSARRRAPGVRESAGDNIHIL